MSICRQEGNGAPPLAAISYLNRNKERVFSQKPINEQKAQPKQVSSEDWALIVGMAQVVRENRGDQRKMSGVVYSRD
ncbi:MAG TPA: hypothetical protein VD999_00545 [Vitreimonas sp.]|nr:hypothetical protein [Vitreimonas sp.]